jgi:hypothetical protein
MPNFFGGGGPGGDGEAAGKSCLSHHVFQHHFRHGGTANVAVADKKYVYHVSFSPSAVK